MVLRVVWGSGTGPTALAAYDAALIDAGVGNHNLVRLSSVLPADVALKQAGTAPALGPVGSEVRVVEASATAAPGETAGAALGWVRREDGSGLFYEQGSSGDEPNRPASDAAPDGGSTAAQADPVAARERAVAEVVRTGLAAGVAKRGWSVGEPTVVTQGARAAAAAGDHAGRRDAYASAVVLVTYGTATHVGAE